MSDEVLVSYENGIAEITINRPQARNAVNKAVAEGVAAALDELDSRDDLTIGIVTGAGGTFCAGMDLKAFVRGEKPYAGDRGFAGIVEKPSEKPLIAAVEGYALAGGCEVMLACDLVVAARNAAFGLPEVKRGLVAAGGGLIRLPERIPYYLAMELSLTGEHLPAERAYAAGLVNRLVDQGEALAGARDLAATIVANGPLAVRATKRIIKESADWSADTAFAKQSAIAQPISDSADAREGATAFAEKRAPVWTGR